MKIVKWDRYGNNSYPDLEDTSTKEEICEAWDVLVEEIRKNGYLFNGTYHQRGSRGAPVFDNGKMYRLSFREWGQVMLEAHPFDVDTYSELAWGDMCALEFKYPMADKSDVPMKAMVIQPICDKTYKEIAETRDRATRALEELGYEVTEPIISNKWAEKRNIKDDTVIQGLSLYYLGCLLKQMSRCNIVYFTDDLRNNTKEVDLLMRAAVVGGLEILYEGRKEN